MNLDETLAPFLTWQFVAAALSINALLAYVRRAVKTSSPVTLEKKWFKTVMTSANPVAGMLVALVPGFLYGQRLVDRLFVGLCAGLMSSFVYSLVIKRLLTTSGSSNKVELQSLLGSESENMPEGEDKP